MSTVSSTIQRELGMLDASPEAREKPSPSVNAYGKVLDLIMAQPDDERRMLYAQVVGYLFPYVKTEVWSKVLGMVRKYLARRKDGNGN